jgi:hypothetical protein
MDIFSVGLYNCLGNIKNTLIWGIENGKPIVKWGRKTWGLKEGDSPVAECLL